jgi:glycosyltransferase involved in cell wall biosynthesis
MKVIAVIPAYNESATIEEVVDQTLEQLEQVIVIDDASTDGTSDQLQNKAIQLVQNVENLGKGGSLWRGIQIALDSEADAVITLDADGQHRPEDIPLLLEAAQKTPGKIIIGSRDMKAGRVPRERLLANRIANFWISWAAGYPITDSQSGFRLYPAELFNKINIEISRQKSFVFESEILIEAAYQGVGSRSVSIPALYAANRRPSHFHPVRDIVSITRMVAWKLIRHGLAPLGLLRALGLMKSRL